MNHSIIDVEGEHIQFARDEAEAKREAEAREGVCQDILLLLAKKNAGYGRNLQRHGVKGITIRLSDKVMRLENQVLGANPDYVGESITETLWDIVGYGVMALSLLRLDDLSIEGEWRGVSPHKFVVHPWEDKTRVREVEVTGDTAAKWTNQWRAEA